MRAFNRENIKLAVFDLDDTTIVHGRMSDAVHDSICLLKEKGIVTVVATARDRTQIDSFMSECFSFFITANGSCVESFDGTIIDKKTIDRDTAYKIINRLFLLGGRSFVYCGGYMIMSVGSLVRMVVGRPIKDIIHNKSGNWNSKVTINPAVELKKSEKPVFKIGSCFKKYDRMENAVQKIASEFGVNTSISSDRSILEVLADGVNKESAVKTLCNYLSVDINSTIAFGDSNADVEMLKQSGFAVAMKNGDSSAIEASDFVAPDVKEDGVAKAIKELFAF